MCVNKEQIQTDLIIYSVRASYLILLLGVQQSHLLMPVRGLLSEVCLVCFLFCKDGLTVLYLDLDGENQYGNTL